MRHKSSYKLIVISSNTVAPASGMRNGPPWMPPSTAPKGTILTPFVLKPNQEDIP
ncbi:hypothetical protein [Myroides sp. DF42-4-2]|uniref:hypothetical protein n=1 Tax=unclassified Myroides TaxID=2642485 RepID=UPI0025784E39|nr:hypothetical protein [Myroides sp. DF42-4-2]MDM1407268.1 hypothetical protein [Myroides sp. DF42-4-2]